jgi:hypothetical protein
MRKHLGTVALVFFVLLATLPALHADEVLELKAANFDPVAGIWHDSSGNGNDASAGVPPVLTPGQTLNGSAVVTFDGATTFLMMNPGISAGAFTCFAYLRPMPGDSRTIMGGGTGSFQYRIGGDGFGDSQEVLQRNLVRLGVSNTQLDTTSGAFSLISITYAGTPGTFRLAETDDGTPGFVFFSPTNMIGAASGPGEFYLGDIAEIRIYNEVMSDTDRATIEEAIRTTYEPQ